jgi:hypothetical protein
MMMMMMMMILMPKQTAQHTIGGNMLCKLTQGAMPLFDQGYETWHAVVNKGYAIAFMRERLDAAVISCAACAAAASQVDED